MGQSIQKSVISLVVKDHISFFYELFLDEKGQKISKSKGNGLTIDEWLRYAPQESLAYYMYLSPQRAKKLYFDVIPKSVDEYIQHWKSYAGLDQAKKLDNPLYHIHNGNPPALQPVISFALLLNLVSACNSADNHVIWGYIHHTLPDSTPENSPFLNTLVEKAINYYHDFIKPNKTYRPATEKEKIALNKLLEILSGLDAKATAEEIQNHVYAIAMELQFEQKDWFKALYEILLGAEQGPRFGSFVALYGIAETIELIKSKI
jgi:lysyl-tRNA synthetase class 1